jgi:lysozyme
MEKIIDVSKHNGDIDFEAVKKDGITGVICQLGYGCNFQSQDDYTFVRNVQNAYKAGLKVGAYIYSYAQTTQEAVSEAYHAITQIERCEGKITGPVWLDLEEIYLGRYAKDVLKDFTNIMNAHGYEVGIYTGLSYYNTYLNGVTGYPLWLASYGGDDGTVWDDYKPNKGEIIWQYTSNGRVKGIDGDVDVNISYGWGDDMTTAEVEKVCNDMIYKYNRLQTDELMAMVDRKIDKVVQALAPKKYSNLDEVPEWGKETVKKLVEKGYIVGDDKGLSLTYDTLRVYVSLDRKGLFD